MSIATAATAVKPLSEARSRARRALARLARRVLPDAHVRLAHLEPGLRLRVNLRRNVMFWSGGLARFEPECVRVLRAAAAPGSVALDVGSNIGFFATLLSRWVGPSGRVVAVEPDPANLALLRRNLIENHCGNVKVVAAAIGAEPGEAEFSRDAATGATGRLGRSATAGELAVGRGRVEVVRTPVETLDRLAAGMPVPPGLVKIDIEGGEAEALRGATALLRDARPVIVAETTGDDAEVALAILRAADYRLWDLETARPVAPGAVPFMVVAVPAEGVDSARGRRIRAALVGPADAAAEDRP